MIFLQLAILLSSIATVMKKKAMWGLGLALAGLGFVYFANGHLMFM
ncbi:MAG: DUF4337 family protein [Deltaproteobacteria bacterium]|nr:DUF4337 family protein [Deltaproteobacteria bacterium]